MMSNFEIGAYVIIVNVGLAIVNGVRITTIIGIIAGILIATIKD